MVQAAGLLIPVAIDDDPIPVIRDRRKNDHGRNETAILDPPSFVEVETVQRSIIV